MKNRIASRNKEFLKTKAHRCYIFIHPSSLYYIATNITEDIVLILNALSSFSKNMFPFSLLKTWFSKFQQIFYSDISYDLSLQVYISICISCFCAHNIKDSCKQVTGYDFKLRPKKFCKKSPMQKPRSNSTSKFIFGFNVTFLLCSESRVNQH